MKKYIVYALGILCFLSPFVSHAALFKSEKEIKVDTPIEESAYIASEKIEILQDVNGDFLGMGRDIHIEGNILEELNLLGAQVRFSGAVQDDMRIVGNEIFINGNVKEDMLLIGNVVKIASDTVIEGEATIVASEVFLEGTFLGDVHLHASNINLASNIKGNAHATAYEELVISNQAKIEKDFYYQSMNDVNLPANVVMGNAEFERSVPKSFSVFFDESSFTKSGVLFYLLISFMLSVITLFSGTILLGPFKKVVVNVSHFSYEYPWSCLLTGFITIILLPIFAMILFMTTVGIPLSIFLWGLFFILFFFSKTFVGAIIGQRILPVDQESPYLKVLGAFAAGTVVIDLIALIPFLGWFIKLSIILIFFGAMVRFHESILACDNRKLLSKS